MNMETNELFISKSCTKEKLLETLATKGVTGANAEAIISSLGLSTANSGLAVSFKVLSASIKEMLLLNPMAWIMIGISAIYGAVKAIDHFTVSAEEARQKAEGFASSASTAMQNMSSNTNTLAGLDAEYQSLAKGVNNLGENVSLSAEQYARYKEIIGQVSDIMPGMTAYFNSQGEAIGFTDGKLSSLTSTYEKYMQAQAKEFVTKGDEDGNTFQDVLDNFNNNSEMGTGENFWNTFKNSFGFYDEDDLPVDTMIGTLKELQGKTKEEVTAFLNNIDLDVNGQYMQTAGNRAKAIAQDILETTTGEIRDMSDEEFQALQSSIAANIQRMQNETDVDMGGVTAGLLQTAYASDDFWAMGENQRNGVTTMLSSINADTWKALGKTTEADAQAFVDNLITAISDKNGDVSNAWNQLFELDSSTLSAAEYATQVETFMKTICEAMGITDESEQKKFMISIGFDIDTTRGMVNGLKEKLATNTEGMSKGIRDVSNAKTNNWVDTLTEKELELANSGAFDEALEKRKDALDGAALSVLDYMDILEDLKIKEATMGETTPARTLADINSDKSSLDSLFNKFESSETGSLGQEEVATILEENPEYIQYLTKVGDQYRLNQKALDDWNAIMSQQEGAIDNQMGGNEYLANYDDLLGNIKSDESHGEGSGLGDTNMAEEEMDKLIEKNRELNQSLMEGKISTAEYFDGLSEKITDSGLEDALGSLNGQFDDTTDYLEETVSVLGAELSDAMLQSNKRFLKGETSVGDYADELKSGAKAQQKLLKSTYGLTIGQDGYAEAIEGADEATQDAIDSYNDLVDAQADLNSVDSFIDTLSDNADFLSSYTDEAGNLMDSVMDDSRFSDYVSSLSQDLVAFAGTSEENMNSVVLALMNAAGLSAEEAMALVQQGAGAVETAVGGSLGSLQGMTNFAMNTVGNSINNTSSAIGSVLSSLGNAISGFDFKIEAKPYITGWLGLRTDENGVPNGLDLPTFGFDITGTGGASVAQFADALANAGSYFSNAGAAQAGSNALGINSYKPSGSGKGATAAGARPSTKSPGGTKPNSPGGGSGSGGSGGSGGGASEAAKETVETFDWVENKLESLERHVKKLDRTVGRAYKGWSERNSALNQEILEVGGQVWGQVLAYQEYMKKADAVGLSEHYKNLVKDGAIAIEDISDEGLKQQISDFTKWYEKARKCEEEAENLADTLADLGKTLFEHATQMFEGRLSVMEYSLDMIEAYIDQAEARGRLAGTAYYDSLIKTEQGHISLLKEEYGALTEAMANAMEKGGIEKYSEEWYDMYDAILDVDKAITEATTSLYEHQNALRELKWDYFEKQQEYTSKLTEEADWLIGLLEKQGSFVEDGDSAFAGSRRRTRRGTAAEGLHALNYNVYMAQADDYAKEILKINEMLAKDPYNLELIEKRNEFLEAQRDNIDAAHDEIEAVKDLMSEGYDAYLDKLQQLIDKRKEALGAERDLYDYQKSIAEKTGNIASLEKQLNAYAGDDSEEAASKVQQLKLELDEAKTDLEETEYEKWVSDQERLMDDLYTEYEQLFNQRLDDIEFVLESMKDTANANAGSIMATLEQATAAVGTALSDEMKNIWKNDGGAGSIVSTYGSGMTAGLTSIQQTLDGIRNFVSAMAGDARQEAADNVAALETRQEAAANKAPTPPAQEAPKQELQTLEPAGSRTDTSFFVHRKDEYPKNKLNVETSIVDRLKYHDYDSSFGQMAHYYAAMGFSGTYTGLASQNINMLG